MIGLDAFQGVDIGGITTPITKANFTITDIRELPSTTDLAFKIACSQRPGPVLIEIPSDVQKEEIELSKISFSNNNIVIKDTSYKLHIETITIFKQYLQESKKLLIICVGRVNIAGCMELLNIFCPKNRRPVVHTIRGIGVNPYDEDLYYALIGMHGIIYGNYAAQQVDLIIALGVRFSDRTICNKNEFAKNAKIIHINIDPSEVNKNIKIDFPVICDLKIFLSIFSNIDLFKPSTEEWFDELKSIKASNPSSYQMSNGIKLQYLIEIANKYFGDDAIVVSDVGQNQIWAAQYYRIRKQRSFICSADLGTMGYSLPAAIGAKIGCPNRDALVITGDGGFQMNIQELITIKRYNLDIKILNLDNQSLGMVRQWQELFYSKRYVATIMDDNPSFYKIAQAIGIDSIYLDDIDKTEEAIRKLRESSNCMLLYAKIKKYENVLPIVPPKQSLERAIK